MQGDIRLEAISHLLKAIFTEGDLLQSFLIVVEALLTLMGCQLPTDAALPWACKCPPHSCSILYTVHCID